MTMSGKNLFLATCCMIGSGTLFGMDKCGYFMERIYVSSLEYKKNEEKKSFGLKKDEKFFPITQTCTFSRTGELFCHSFNKSNNNDGGIRLYDAKSYQIVRDIHYSGTIPIDSIILTGGINGDWLRFTQYFFSWEPVENWRGKYYQSFRNEFVKTAELSPSGNRIIDGRDGETTFFDKSLGVFLRWYRGAGKRDMFMGEHYIASVPNKSSQLALYTVDAEPTLTELEQGEDFLVQETCLSKDSKIMGVASTYDKEDKKLTKIKLYDVESQKEKSYGFVPGLICDEKDGDIFFDNDGKSIVVHTRMNDGLNSYVIDVRSDEFKVVETFKHRKNTKQLCPLVGGYFASIGENRVSIFDMNNSRDVIDVSNLQPFTHVALDPNEPSKKAIIALASGNLYRYIAPKNNEIKDMGESIDLITFDDF